jgi:hypothetical protein
MRKMSKRATHAERFAFQKNRIVVFIKSVLSIKMRVAIFVLLCVVSITSFVQAQTTEKIDPLTVIQQRAVDLADRAMHRSSGRAESFNHERSDVNDFRPLDPKNLDSVHITASRTRVRAFLDFLGRYRDTSTIVIQQLEDSLSVLRSEMPKQYRETFLRRFYKAYSEDVKEFDAYTMGVSELYKSVLVVLDFVQHAHYHVVGDQLEFTKRPDYETYLKLLKNIDVLNKQVTKSMLHSQKANGNLHQAMEQLVEDPNE